METITLTSASKSIRYDVIEKKMNDEAFTLIRHINFILEMIIINTLQYNKLTSAEEIYEKMIAEYPDKQLELENEIDSGVVDNICHELCNNNGVLIKLTKNNMRFYKLNHKNYM